MPGSAPDPSARSPWTPRSAHETSRDARARPSNHVLQHIDHRVDFLVLQMRIHRQGENSLRLAFGHRELPFAIAEVGAAAHGMDRPTVGNVAVDIALRQSLQHAVAIRWMLDHVDIVAVAAMYVL